MATTSVCPESVNSASLLRASTFATADRLPSVVVGNGFTVPPRLSPLPGIRPDQRSASDLSREREAEVLAAVNEVLSAEAWLMLG